MQSDQDKAARKEARHADKPAHKRIPKVGRNVQFFTSDTNKQFNGAGVGPYAATVTQTFPDSDMVNLKVHPWGSSYDEGSVLHGAASGDRYWEFINVVDADEDAPPPAAA